MTMPLFTGFAIGTLWAQQRHVASPDARNRAAAIMGITGTMNPMFGAVLTNQVINAAKAAEVAAQTTPTTGATGSSGGGGGKGGGGAGGGAAGVPAAAPAPALTPEMRREIKDTAKAIRDAAKAVKEAANAQQKSAAKALNLFGRQSTSGTGSSPKPRSTPSSPPTAA